MDTKFAVLQVLLSLLAIAAGQGTPRLAAGSPQNGDVLLSLLEIAAGLGTPRQTTGSPLNVDPTLDCAISELAWEFAKKLLPQRGGFKSAYDALRLSDCGVSLESGRRYVLNPFRYPSEMGTDAVKIYVATNGSDTNPGTLDDPVQTLRKAVEIYRSNSGSGGVIYVRGGTYYLTETLELGPPDSNLIITGYKDEKVVISGGKQYNLSWNEIVPNEIGLDMNGVNAMYGAVSLPGESNNKVAYHGKVSSHTSCRNACENNETCFAYTWYESSSGLFAEMCYFRIDGLWLPTSERGIYSGKKLHVFTADLSAQDPKKFSTFFLNQRRAVRARYPDGNPETMGLYTSPTGYVSSARRWLGPREFSNLSEIRIESPQRNTTYFQQFELGIGGPVQEFDPPQSFWGIPHPTDFCSQAYTIPTGLEYSSGEWIAGQNWSRPDTDVVHAFHGLLWANWQFAVDARDKDTHQITWSRGGFQEARGYTSGAQWYVENIRELLDAPGEWYYDDQNFTLFYYPNGTNLPTTGVGTFLEQLIAIRGSMDNPVMNITIANLTFTQTEPTYLSDYEVPSGGDWAIHRGGTVFVEGVDGFLLQNCIFDSPGGNALFLSNYIRRAVIERNEFVYTGDSAIAAVGSSDLINGTSGNQPRGTKVINNLMHEIGIWGKQTSGYFQALTAETELYGNVMFNGPRAGINFNDGFGGGHHVEMNLIFNMVRETIDNGPFNSWDRLPYLTGVKDGTPSLTPAQSNITRNFFICNYHAIYPLDHDDGSCCYQDTYNYFVYGGYKNNLGHNKVVKHNVYIYPDAVNVYNFIDNDYGIAVKPFCGWSEGDFPAYGVDVWANNTCIIGGPDIYEFLKCNDFKSNAQLIPFTANNSIYAPNKSIYIQCEFELWSLQEFQDKGHDKGTQVFNSDDVDCDMIVNWGKELLGLTWRESICRSQNAATCAAVLHIVYIVFAFCTALLLL